VAAQLHEMWWLQGKPLVAMVSIPNARFDLSAQRAVLRNV
jgi:hypothetical protein